MQPDIDYIIKNSKEPTFLFGSSILITGATGLLGSVLVHTLSEMNDIYQLSMTIYVQARNEEKATLMFCNLIENRKIKLIIQDIEKPIKLPDRLDYIVHTASPTSSLFFVKYPVETISTAYSGTKNLLELAKQKKIKNAYFRKNINNVNPLILIQIPDEDVIDNEISSEKELLIEISNENNNLNINNNNHYYLMLLLYRFLNIYVMHY